MPRSHVNVNKDHSQRLAKTNPLAAVGVSMFLSELDIEGYKNFGQKTTICFHIYSVYSSSKP